MANKTNARDMQEKLMAKNKCIIALMDAMDNILTMKAKINVVNALSEDSKT